jgi:hypothetical protein
MLCPGRHSLTARGRLMRLSFVGIDGFTEVLAASPFRAPSLRLRSSGVGGACCLSTGGAFAEARRLRSRSKARRRSSTGSVPTLANSAVRAAPTVAIEDSSGDSSDMDPPRPRQRAYESLGPIGQPNDTPVDPKKRGQALFLALIFALIFALICPPIIDGAARAGTSANSPCA